MYPNILSDGIVILCKRFTDPEGIDQMICTKPASGAHLASSRRSTSPGDDSSMETSFGRLDISLGVWLLPAPVPVQGV